MQNRLAAIWQDTMGFAAAKMIRRILGLAHVEDLENIAKLDRRVACEARALSFARSVLLGRHAYTSAYTLATAVAEAAA